MWREPGSPFSSAEHGRVVLGDVVQGTHGVHVEVLLAGNVPGPLTQLDAGNAQGPDVHFAVVLALVHGQDHLGGHPVRCAHKRVGRADHRRRPKVR
ncbi:unnamed protein product [Ixodes pacificus]